MAGLGVPLSTLRLPPYDRRRMTRGQDGWLGLSCTTLAFATPRRSPGASCQFIFFPFLDSDAGVAWVAMPRLLRPVADGLMYQALNRGNNRATVFDAAEDY